MYGIIYKITNLINGKLYVGKTTKDLQVRWKTHIKNATQRGRHSRLYAAIRKYGADNFAITKIDGVNETSAKLNKREQYWIFALHSKDPSVGYNMTDGGDGGAVPGIAAINRNMRLGKPLSEAHKQKISAANKGKCPHPMTKAMRAKVSKSVKQKYLDPTYKAKVAEMNKAKAKKGKDHPMFGKTHSLSARSAIRASRQGKTWEEIYGVEVATKLKAEARNRMMGNTHQRGGHE